MRAGKKISHIASFKVLGKYEVSLIIVSTYEIDRWFVKFPKAEEFWVMNLDSFNKYFPKVTSLLLYKKLFSNTARITHEDFRRYLPSRIYYKYRTPQLQQVGDFLAFYSEEGTLWRKEIATWFRSIENLEKTLRKKKFKVETTEEKE